MEIYQADWYLLSGMHLLSFAYIILITFLVAWSRLLEQATLFTDKEARLSGKCCVDRRPEHERRAVCCLEFTSDAIPLALLSL